MQLALSLCTLASALFKQPGLQHFLIRRVGSMKQFDHWMSMIRQYIVSYFSNLCSISVGDLISTMLGISVHSNARCSRKLWLRQPLTLNKGMCIPTARAQSELQKPSLVACGFISRPHKHATDVNNVCNRSSKEDINKKWAPIESKVGAIGSVNHVPSDKSRLI